VRTFSVGDGQLMKNTPHVRHIGYNFVAHTASSRRISFGRPRQKINARYMLGY
jgi:hypothetical protein